MANPHFKKIPQYVSAQEGDVRLDRFLRRHFPALSQSLVQKLCRGGDIRCEGKKVKPSHRLYGGDVVHVPKLVENFVTPQAAVRSPHSDKKLREEFSRLILFEDEMLIFINKPAGLAVQGGRHIGKHLDLMLDACAGKMVYRPSLVHRLDRDTSGVLLLAKTPRAAAFLTKAFRTRQVQKNYWAVTDHKLLHKEGFIATDRRGDILEQGHKLPKDYRDDHIYAFSRYRSMQKGPLGLSWLSLTPFTGRKHQLRIHCASLGIAICGDQKYNDKPALYFGKKWPLMLHARYLKVPHPQGGSIKMTAPLTGAMAAFFETAQFHLCEKTG